MLQGGIGIAAHKNLGSGETTDEAERPRNNKAMSNESHHANETGIIIRKMVRSRLQEDR